MIGFHRAAGSVIASPCPLPLARAEPRTTDTWEISFGVEAPLTRATGIEGMEGILTLFGEKPVHGDHATLLSAHIAATSQQEAR